jgi:hypothetical protein
MWVPSQNGEWVNLDLVETIGLIEVENPESRAVLGAFAVVARTASGREIILSGHADAGAAQTKLKAFAQLLCALEVS